MYLIHPWILYCVKHSLIAVSDITRVCMATENVSLMGLYLFPKGEINMDSSDQDQAVNVTPSQMLVKVGYSTVHFSTVLKRVDHIHNMVKIMHFVCTSVLE